MENRTTSEQTTKTSDAIRVRIGCNHTYRTRTGVEKFILGHIVVLFVEMNALVTIHQYSREQTLLLL